MSKNIDIVISAQDRASSVLKGIQNRTEGLREAVGGYVKTAGIALAGLSIYGLKLAGDLEQTRVAFDTMLGSAEKSKQLMGELSEFAKTTPFEFPEIARAGKSLLAFGFEAEQLQGNLRMLGDIASGLNIPFNELSDIYGKIRVQGRLYQEDINQLTGRGIPVIQELANQFGVAESEVKKLVETGQVGFPEIEKAFQNLTGEGSQFGGMMDKQSKTLNGQLSTLKDNLELVLIDLIGINKEGEIREGSLLDETNKMVERLNKALESGELQSNLEDLKTLIKGIINFFVLWGKAIYTISESLVYLGKKIDWLSTQMANMLPGKGSAKFMTDFIKGLQQERPKLDKEGKEIMSSMQTHWGPSSTTAQSAPSWGINMVEMFISGMQKKKVDIERTANSLMVPLRQYIGFRSPTEKGPGKDSDKWMPNLINMLADGLKDGEKVINDRVIKIASKLAMLNDGKSLGLEKTQKVFDNLKNIFDDTFSNLNGNIDESKNKLNSLGDEIKGLKDKLKDFDKDLGKTDREGRGSLSNRALELEREIADLKKEEGKQDEIRLKEEELALAKKYITEEELEKARIEANKTETEKILDNIKIKLSAISQEKAEAQALLLQKEQELITEEQLYKNLTDKKIEFENNYFSLYQEHLQEMKVGINEAISLMTKLNELGGGSLIANPGINEMTGKNEMNTGGGSLNNNISLNFGNVNINNGMDLNTFTNNVKNELINSLKLSQYGIS